MKKKVLIGPSSFGSSDSAPLDLLKENGCRVIDNPYKRKLTRQELLELLPGIDGLVAGLEPLDRDVLVRSELKVISRCGSGISNVDVDACEELGIAFKFTPYGPTQAVGELTVAMMINLLRKVVPMHNSLVNGRWDKRVGMQLKGKTVCIIGFGRIGRRTAELLLPFQVDLVVVDPFITANALDVRQLELHQALSIADVVVLHMSDDDCVLNREALSQLKPGAYICNAARGTNMDEAALLEGLEKGSVSGAWLDCFTDEPYNGPLCQHPNVILTPHVGSYTKEGRLAMEMECARNMIDGLIETG